ncbi:MAG: tetratricopeptide repeat protein [Planctomycetota bacterium]
MNIDELRKNYSGMTDRQILDIATEVNKLTKDGQIVLKEEMEKRNLDKNTMDIGLTQLSDGETDKLINDFIQSLCPICGKKTGINGLYINRSNIIYIEKEFIFGCRDCLIKELSKEESKTWKYILLAMFIFTIPILITKLTASDRNDRAKNKINTNNTDELITWIKENKGKVYLHLRNHKSGASTTESSEQKDIPTGKYETAISWYNQGCIYANKGDRAEALKNLAEALKLDVKFKDTAKNDRDFKTLWNDEEFKKLVN